MTTDDAHGEVEELIEAHRLGNPDALRALRKVSATDTTCDDCGGKPWSCVEDETPCPYDAIPQEAIEPEETWDDPRLRLVEALCDEADRAAQRGQIGGVSVRRLRAALRGES